MEETENIYTYTCKIIRLNRVQALDSEPKTLTIKMTNLNRKMLCKFKTYMKYDTRMFLSALKLYLRQMYIQTMRRKKL